MPWRRAGKWRIISTHS